MSLAEIRLSDALFSAVIDGKKKATTRIGPKAVPGQRVMIVTPRGSKVIVTVDLVHVLQSEVACSKYYALEGYYTPTDMEEALKGIYRTLEPDTLVYVHRFRLEVGQ